MLALFALAAAPMVAETAAGPPSGPSIVLPGRELILPPTEVRDTFFAWLVGVVDAGRDATIDNAGLRDILTEFASSIALPFDRIVEVRHRAPSEGGPGILTIDFDGEIDIPVPFSVLWYHPGSLGSTRTLRFDERRFPSVAAGRDAASPVYAFHLVEGAMTIDVDAWLDVLLGNVVDDLSVRLVAIARWHGSWRCLLGGTGRENRRIIAAFDLARNTITFPVPKELVRLGLDLWNAR
jgi:hypothetical protein